MLRPEASREGVSLPALVRAAADARQICAGEINSRSLVERALVRLGAGAAKVTASFAATPTTKSSNSSTAKVTVH